MADDNVSTSEQNQHLNTLREELAQRLGKLAGFRGIGLTVGPGGTSVLVVYIDSLDCPAANATPKTLGEVPVTIQVTGRIQLR